jgi:hypothetical protein
MKTPLSDKTTREIGAIAEERGCRLLGVESAGAGRFRSTPVLERRDGTPRRSRLQKCRAGVTVLDAADGSAATRRGVVGRPRSQALSLEARRIRRQTCA